jgi:hypothetical protein
MGSPRAVKVGLGVGDGEEAGEPLGLGLGDRLGLIEPDGVTERLGESDGEGLA